MATAGSAQRVCQTYVAGNVHFILSVEGKMSYMSEFEYELSDGQVICMPIYIYIHGIFILKIISKYLPVG